MIEKLLMLGLYIEHLTQTKTVLYGTNFFFDKQLHTGHQRLGIGFEVKSSAYAISI